MWFEIISDEDVEGGKFGRVGFGRGEGRGQEGEEVEGLAHCAVVLFDVVWVVLLVIYSRLDVAISGIVERMAFIARAPVRCSGGRTRKRERMLLGNETSMMKG